MSDGLVGYWKMDESATTSGATDSSGNGNTGTYGGNASTTAGKFGNGGVFATSTSDYVEVTDASQTGLEPSSDFSISAWVNIKQFSETDWRVNCIVCKNGNSGNFSYNFGPYHWNNDNDVFIFQVSANGTTYSLSTWTENTVGLSTDVWYHVVGVFEQSSGGYVYIDGVRADINGGSGPVASGAYNSTAAFKIGNSDSDRPLNGQIDEVRIYNRALSPDEVRHLYEWAPGPVAWWKFDEKSGTTVYDSAASTTYSGGNNGILGMGTPAYMPGWTQGKHGSALKYDGADDYVHVPGDPSDLINGAFTFSAWVKIEGDCEGGSCTFIDHLPGDAYGEFKYYEQGGAQDLYFRTRDKGASTVYIQRDFPMDANQWYYITLVYDLADAYLYGNGIQLGSSQSFGALLYGTNYWTIGADGNGSINNFNGLIDDVRIYNYALDQKQILAVMQGGGPSTGSGRNLVPVLELNFDEGYGETAYDSNPACKGQKTNCNNGMLYPGTLGSNTAMSAMWSLDGKFGKAMEFDGTDDYVYVGSVTGAPTGSEPRTVILWFNTKTFDTAMADPIFQYTSNNTGGGYWFRLFAEDNAVSVGYMYGRLISPKNALSTNIWYHVAARVPEGAVNTTDFELFINGIEQALTIEVGSTYAINTGSSNVYIGKETFFNAFFNGLIDEVKIYNYALTEEEIQLDYNQGKATVMGQTGKSNSTATSSSAASLEYCVPGSSDYCAAPVLELKMDEFSGTTTYDISGQGNDGVFVNSASSPAWKSSGYCQMGSCLEFDGSDYEIPGEGVGTGLLDVHTAHTLSAWFNTNDKTDRQVIFIEGGSSQGWSIMANNGQGTPSLAHTINGAGDVDCRTEYPVANINNNQWYHITGVFDGNNTDSFLYLNGALVASNGTCDNSTTDPMYGWRIGGLGTEDDDQYNNSVNDDFNGLIDQVRIYNYARTPAQIAWDYNRGKPIAHWRFDECSGDTIYDQSGNGNNGTLNLGTTGVIATGTCASSSDTFWYNGRTGKYNSGGSFDGTDDYVLIGTNLSLIKNLDEMSFGAWIKLDSLKDQNVIDISINNGGVPITTSRFEMGVAASGKIYLRGRAPDTDGYDEEVSVSALSTGQWYYLTGNINFKLNYMEIYVNGAEMLTTGITNFTNRSTDDTVSAIASIGSQANGSGAYFEGLIDEVKIFNYALTAEQVKMEYAGGAVRFGE